MLRVFIASPRGLEAERIAFKETIDQCNQNQAKARGFSFEPVAWDEVMAGMGRPQKLINEQLRTCDYCILILQDRWGTPPSSDPTHPYTSGSEEEWHEAVLCYESSDHPMRNVVLYFKDVPEAQLADPGGELQKVLKFRKRIEKEQQAYYGSFDTTEAFAEKVQRHLSNWIVEVDQNLSLPIQPVQTEGPDGPEIVPSDTTNKLLRQAQQAADDGHPTDAAVLFSQAFVHTPGSVTFNAYGRFLHRIGHLDRAEAMFEKSVVIEEALGNQEGMARAYGNLGIVYKTRGDLDRAEAMFEKALVLNEALGRKEGMASDYGNLALVYKTRGDLDRAEAMFEKSVAIEEALGHEGGMARVYGNLGLVYQTREDLDRAEAMHKKALALNEALDSKEGMASNYTNLGLVYQTRGDLDRAEPMFEKALTLNEALSRKEGIARSYGNLGNVHQTRGDLDRAGAMYKKSLAIDEVLGRKEGMAITYGNLGLAYQTRGDLDRAEAMLEKSLALNEALGSKEGMASDYGSLGFVYEARGDFDRAGDAWGRSLSLFEELRAIPKVELVQGLLDQLE